MNFAVAVKAKHRERRKQPRIVHFQEAFICPFFSFYFKKKKF